MGQYFKPLRRKVGVLMLILACAFVAAWVRSFMTMDRIEFWRAGELHTFVSNGGRAWFRVSAPAFFQQKKSVSIFKAIQKLKWESEPQRKIVDPLALVSEKSRYQFLGFGYGSGFQKSAGRIWPFRVWTINHASIVIPLTLLSTWLLLSKPRTKKTQSIEFPPATKS